MNNTVARNVVDSKEAITKTAILQEISRSAYLALTSQLRSGITELEASTLLKKELEKVGITNYWYDIPLIILFGANRFKIGAIASYDIKAPSSSVFLQDGDPIYVDMHPMDIDGQWGDWNTMAVFHPSVDDEQLSFLDEMRNIHRLGIASFNSMMTGSDVVDWVSQEYRRHGINPLWDPKRNDVGHTIHHGPKSEAERIFLERNNHKTIDGRMFTFEPGGYRVKRDKKGIVVARFEEIFYVSRNETPQIVGNTGLPSLVI